MRAHRPDARGEPPPPTVVELRVHGVGGASPEGMLDVPVTSLVAGDESAGFFRPWHPDGSDNSGKEAYSWGGLTSASRLRALWVLLAPFALSNLAGWMLRHGGEASDTWERQPDLMERVAIAAVRIFGLLTTVALAAYFGLAAVDLVGFQCGKTLACVADRWWLAPWRWGAVAGQANRATAMGVLVALAAVLAVAWLTRRSQIALHRKVDFNLARDPTLTVNLNHDELWESPQVAHRLGLTHTAAAMVAVALTAAVPGTGVGDLGPWATIPGWLLLATTMVAAVHLDGVRSRIHFGLVGLAAIYLVLVVSGIWFGDSLTGERLIGSDALAAILFPAWALAILAVAVLSWILWRRSPHGPLRTAAAAPALLLGAVGMVSAVGSGLLIRLADLLGRPEVASGDSAGAPLAIVVPDWVADVSVVTVFGILVLGVVAAIAWFRAGPGPACHDLAVRYADRGGLDCADPDDVEWAKTVGRAEAVARVTDRAAAVLGTAAVVVLVGLAVAVIWSDDPAGLGLGSWTEPLAQPASVVLGLVPVVAVVAIARLYRSRAVRRVVGVLWDVAVFWPRWFHPWSPPSYGERAVRQLRGRVETLAGASGTVLSAHSQGSVLAVAALVGVGAEARQRTALLTHGSPIGRLYSRFFPEYFSADLCTRLAKDMAGWVNLWRLTDFIGGPIEAEGVVDREVFDPPSTRPTMVGEPRPVPLRHSHYEQTDEYSEAIVSLTRRIEGG